MTIYKRDLEQLPLQIKMYARDGLPVPLATRLQRRKGGRPGTYCTCICAHAPNNPDVLPYNTPYTDEKRGVNIRLLGEALVQLNFTPNI